MNSITNEIADKVFEELKSIAEIKSGGLRLQSIDGGHITFIAKDDDDAFMKGSEMYGVIKRAYGLYQRPSALVIYSCKTWWNLEKFTGNGFDDEYELTVGIN